MEASRIWSGAVAGILLVVILLWLSAAIDLFQSHVSLINTIFFFIAGLTFASLIATSLVFFCYLFNKIPLYYRLALVLFITTIYYFFVPAQTLFGITVLGVWALFSFSLTGGAAKLIFVDAKRNSKVLVCFFAGCLALSILILWIFISTGSFKTIEIGPGLDGSSYQMPNPSLDGTFAVKTLNYGTYSNEAAIKTKSVDGKAFIDGWEGLEGWIRTKFWGFDVSHLPLNGRVWYPAGEGPFPIVLIVHGNHEMSTPSDAGYEYLGKLWASRGFIAISVDENFLNGSWLDVFNDISASPARGWLLLEHLTLCRQWNETEGSPFYKKIDMEKVALIGHSRGGEAIVTAAIFNRLDRYPDDGNIPFDYHFNILALGAIAPVEAQYTPGGIKMELENIDYFAIQGSHDGDLRGFLGDAQYHRIGFTGSDYHFKATLYVFGANHGQFNSVWGDQDISSPAFTFFDKGQLMDASQQQQIVKVYLTALLEVSLHKKKEYLPLFLYHTAGSDFLVHTYYLNQFVDSTYQYIIGGQQKQKQADLSATTLKGGHIYTDNLSDWFQDIVVLKNGAPIDTAVFIGWKKQEEDAPTPEFIIDLSHAKLELNDVSILALTLADGDDEDSADRSEWIDFTVELTDCAGNKSSLPLSSYVPLKASTFACIMKASFLDPLCRKDHVFQTFELPLSSFKLNNPLFDPLKLCKISLRFDVIPSGKIILDSAAIHNDPLKTNGNK